MFLRRVSYSSNASARLAYPFSLPLLRDGLDLEFAAPITLLAGDNGTGKSTLLEALAVTTGVPTAGEDEAEIDASLAQARELGRHLKVAWHTQTKRGFFMRSEDFFAFQKRTNALRADLEAQIAGYQTELESTRNEAERQGLRRAMGYIRGQIAALEKKIRRRCRCAQPWRSVFSLLREAPRAQGTVFPR